MNTNLALLCSFAAILGLCQFAAAETITVNTLEDIVDFGGVQQISDLPGPDGLISMREAVTAANNTAGPQTIAFAIPRHDFWLDTSLALLKVENTGGFVLSDNGTTVDFTSQTRTIGDTNPSGNEVGIYGLMGNFTLPQGAITIAGNNCVVKGLDQVSNFGYAVLITGSSNRVLGCRFFEPFGGITYAAVAIRPFTSVPATGNWIGGTGPDEGNSISTYPGVGVEITGPASDNVVVGNSLTRCHIAGLLIQAGASNTRVGGSTAAERNVISANGTGGNGVPQFRDVELDGVYGTRIEGNYLGTDATGLVAAAPPAAGIEIQGSSGTTIQNNVISGYLSEGIHQGLKFRTGIGIYVTTGQGGVPSTNTTIQGNTLGVGVDRTTSLPNAIGIRIDAQFDLAMNALIGGTNPGDGNVIAHNAGAGIVVTNSSTGVRISRNSIFSNGAPTSLFPAGSVGIDLIGASGQSGVTLNDLLDVDTGGNGLQNYPALARVKSNGGAISIQGSLNSLPSQTFVIEFFSTPVLNPLGYGEGKTYLGSITVATNASGNASIFATLPGILKVGSFVTSTATQSTTGNTSEFSAGIRVGAS